MYTKHVSTQSISRRETKQTELDICFLLLRQVGAGEEGRILSEIGNCSVCVGSVYILQVLQPVNPIPRLIFRSGVLTVPETQVMLMRIWSNIWSCVIGNIKIMLVLVKNGSVPISLIICRAKTSGMTSHYWLLIRQCFTSHFLYFLLSPGHQPHQNWKYLNRILSKYFGIRGRNSWWAFPCNNLMDLRIWCLDDLTAFMQGFIIPRTHNLFLFLLKIFLIPSLSSEEWIVKLYVLKY